MTNFMELTLPAINTNEAFARSVVAAFCAHLNPTVDQLSDVKTAVSEAVTNCIVHGYDGIDGGLIRIRARIEGDTVHIEISDDGVGIADVDKARQPFFTTKPDSERSGMGFTVMESFMDDVKIQSCGRGVSVFMSKNLGVVNKICGE